MLHIFFYFFSSLEFPDIFYFVGLLKYSVCLCITLYDRKLVDICVSLQRSRHQNQVSSARDYKACVGKREEVRSLGEPSDHDAVLIPSEGENERKVGWKYLRLQCNSKESTARLSEFLSQSHPSEECHLLQEEALGSLVTLGHWLGAAPVKCSFRLNTVRDFKEQRFSHWELHSWQGFRNH